MGVLRNSTNVGRQYSASASFAYRDGSLPNANLLLAWYDGIATIGNVVPANFGKLSRGEYNALLDDFCEKFLRPAAQVRSLVVDVTSQYRDLSDWIKKPVHEKLNCFSALANRGSGASHPCDRKRWLDFIIAAHRDGADLPVDVLLRWFVEELRWPESVARELASSYENAIELLKRYDETV
jgi:hypothetical protein